MNTHRRYQSVQVERPAGTSTVVTRTVRNVRVGSLLTLIGEATLYGQMVTVEQSEDGKRWRRIKAELDGDQARQEAA